MGSFFLGGYQTPKREKKDPFLISEPFLGSYFLFLKKGNGKGQKRKKDASDFLFWQKRKLPISFFQKRNKKGKRKLPISFFAKKGNEKGQKGNKARKRS